MKAIVQNAYGSPELLSLEDVETPGVKDTDVLVRVEAAAINAGDYFQLIGSPWLVRFMVGFPRPKDHVLGWDVAGCVEAVGENVRRFQPGDEVFGLCSHAFAEYASAGESNFALKPSNLSFEQVAAVPTAALTALQGLRDQGRMQAGHRVLINGASGGVGHFAVQIGKSFGAEMTGVCSTRNVEMVRSLGADHVVDYTKEDFTRSGKRYDLILDNVANRKYLDLRRVLAPDGIFVSNSGHGGMRSVIKTTILSILMHKRVKMFMAKSKQEDLEFLRGLLESEELTPVIDRTYPLSKAPDGIGYVGGGHARGKVIITI